MPNQIIAVELIVFRNFKNPRLPTTKALAFASSNLSPYVVWALGGQPPYPPAAKPLGGRPYAGGDEQGLLNRLRELGQLAVSLVAMNGDQLVGQITFSPVTLSDGSKPWFGLGPVSVRPEHQYRTDRRPFRAFSPVGPWLRGPVSFSGTLLDVAQGAQSSLGFSVEFTSR